MLKVKKKKKIVEKLWKSKKSKSWKIKKIWLLQKDCEKKIFEKFEKECYDCGNKMLSSIALKNGSLCWKLCEKFVLNSKFLTHFPKTSTLP